MVRKQETAQSDLDLLCVVKLEEEKEALRQSLIAAAPSLHSRFAVKLAPAFFTLDELKKNLRFPFVKQPLKEGRALVGQLPKEIAGGKLSTTENTSAGQGSLT
jgi:hypothetical protein